MNQGRERLETEAARGSRLRLPSRLSADENLRLTLALVDEFLAVEPASLSRLARMEWLETVPLALALVNAEHKKLVARLAEGDRRDDSAGAAA